MEGGTRNYDFAQAPFDGGSWTAARPNIAFLPPIISEFMAENDDSLHDEDGDSSDWIEIHNPDSEPANLQGHSLTDAGADLRKWTFPAVTISANGYLVVFASDKDRVNPASRLHTNFKLSNSGASPCTRSVPAGIVLSEFGAYPIQQEDISYGRDRLTLICLATSRSPRPARPTPSRGRALRRR